MLHCRRALYVISIVALAFIAGPTSAHDAPVDELGCHLEPSSGAYHCMAGPLAGQEFINQDEARAAFGRSQQSVQPEKPNERFKVVSWHLKKGLRKVDYDRIANVLSLADLSVLQNVEFGENGETPLMIVTSVLEKRLNEKICKAWFKNGKGLRGTYAFVWRESQMGFVDQDGELKETCPARPVVWRSTIGKGYMAATFFLKSNHRLFVINAIDDLSEPKPVFKKYGETSWAVVFAGSLKARSKSSLMQDIRKLDFKTALKANSKKNPIQDNFYFKNISLLSSRVINLYEQFPGVAASKLFSEVSDSFPIRAEFSFAAEDLEGVQTQLVSKRKGPASQKKAVVAKVPTPFPAPLKAAQLSSLNEDLENEESALDGGLKTAPRKPVKSGKKSGKKIRKKKRK